MRKTNKGHLATVRTGRRQYTDLARFIGALIFGINIPGGNSIIPWPIKGETGTESAAESSAHALLSSWDSYGEEVSCGIAVNGSFWLRSSAASNLANADKMGVFVALMQRLLLVLQWLSWILSSFFWVAVDDDDLMQKLFQWIKVHISKHPLFCIKNRRIVLTVQLTSSPYS